MALYTYDQSESQRYRLLVSDTFFTLVFVAELVLKLIGLGMRNYFKSYFNRLDFVVVTISLIDLILFNTVIEEDENDHLFIKSLKVLRLLRAIRLARVWR